MNFLRLFFPCPSFLTYLITGIISDTDGLVGSYFIGNIPTSLSGLSLAAQWLFLETIITTIEEGMGNSIFFYIGQHYLLNRIKSLQLFKVFLLIYALVGLSLSLVISAWAETFVTIISTPPTLIVPAVQLFRTSSFSLPFMLLRKGFLNFIYLTESRYLILLQLTQVLSNFALNFIMFGSCVDLCFNWGLDQLGLSIIIISIAEFIQALVFFLAIESLCPLHFLIRVPFWKDLSGAFAEFVRTSWGAVFDSLLRNSLYFGVTLNFLNQLPDESLMGSWKILQSLLWGFLIIPISAISDCIKVKLSTNPEAYHATLKEILPTFFVWLLFSGITSYWASPLLVKFFSPYDINLRVGFSHIFKDLGLGYIFHSAAICLDAVLCGIGQTNLLFYKTLIVSLLTEIPPWILYVSGYFVPTYIWTVRIILANLILDCIVAFCFVVISNKLRHAKENSIQNVKI